MEVDSIEIPSLGIVELFNLSFGRQFQKLTAAELSDLGCLIILISGVTLLQPIGQS